MFVFLLFFKGLGDPPQPDCCDLGHGKCKPQTLAPSSISWAWTSPLVTNYGIWSKGFFARP